MGIPKNSSNKKHLVKNSRNRDISGKIGKILLLFFSSAFAIILAEAGLRFYFFRSFSLPKSEASLRQPLPILGWGLKPNQTITVAKPDYTVKVQTNSKGFRDVDHNYKPRQGIFRILMLGDSFLEAYQVELEESLPRRLDRVLGDRRIEVINLGVGGYGTTQELLLLKEEGIKYKPDLIISAFLPINDVRNNSRELEKALWKSDTMKVFGRPYAHVNPKNGNLGFTMPDFKRSLQFVQNMRKIEAEKDYLDQSAIFYLWDQIAMKKANRWLPAYDPNILYGPILAEFEPVLAGNSISRKEYRRMRDDAWQITQRVILDMCKIGKQNSADFMLLIVPSKIQVDKSYRRSVTQRYPKLDFDITKPNRKIASLATEQKLMVLDLFPAFSSAYDRGEAPLYHEIYDRHWNAEGHALAAFELVSFIVQNNLVPNH